MSVVADEFWDDEWNDYTFEMRGSKISGAEGFLIMFRCQGLMQARGQAPWRSSTTYGETQTLVGVLVESRWLGKLTLAG